MKSRITTYVLIVAAAAVWGFIAWKIFRPKPDDQPAAAQLRRENTVQNAGEESLLLDYRDPFLKDVKTAQPPRAAVRAENKPDRTPAAIPKKPGPPQETPTVKYTGTIRTGGRVFYLFDREGLQHALTPGDALGEYTLTEAWADSARLAKNGEVFTVHLQK